MPNEIYLDKFSNKKKVVFDIYIYRFYIKIKKH